MMNTVTAKRGTMTPLITDRETDMMAALSPSGWLTLDLETTGLAPRRDNIAIVSLRDEAGRIAVLQTRGRPATERFIKWLEAHSLITQNGTVFDLVFFDRLTPVEHFDTRTAEAVVGGLINASNAPTRANLAALTMKYTCLLYTSPSPRDRTRSRMPSSA